ncbi:MAG: hypothetical protein ABSB49_10575 [Polyangia bacterium]|jgi:hypothetical protein
MSPQGSSFVAVAGIAAAALFSPIWPSLCPAAFADGVIFPGARPLGAGGAMRAMATGDAGPQLNPSGISLLRTYQVEGDYQYGRTAGSNDARVSVVDSTSEINLGGALDYTYHRESEGGTQSAHVLGLSLSFPFADKVFIGGSAKYVHLTTPATLTTPSQTTQGFTVDAGLTVRPVRQISVAAVGYNLNDLGIAWLPRGVGGGIAVVPTPMVLILFDTVYEKAYRDPSRDSATYYLGGAEFSFSSAGAVRAGGGFDGVTRNGYLTAGISALSADIGAIDLGLRQDVSGSAKTTIIGVSARLFVTTM